MTKQLIIFGGSGFIGQALCQEAIKQGISVISCSPSGKPSSTDELLNSPLITWLQVDIFVDSNWRSLLDNAYAVVNLIGILTEKPKENLTYQKMIIDANQLIASEVTRHPNVTYIFLSANAGGPFISVNYLQAKRLAEEQLASLSNPVIIFRPGLVVGRKRPSTLLVGKLIYLLAHIPLVSPYFRPIYPVKLDHLAQRVLKESQHKRSACLSAEQI